MSYIINTHKCKSKISLVCSNEAKKIIKFSKKHVSLFFRENQLGDELVRVKKSLEGCNKYKKWQLEELLQEYGVFQDPKGLPHKL